MAYCKFRGRYWAGTVCSFKEADCGSNIQIRHATLVRGKLIVRASDNDDHYYVLVTGKAPKLKIVGWIEGGNAKYPSILGKYRTAERPLFSSLKKDSCRSKNLEVA